MGIQIYIKTEKFKEQGVNLEVFDELMATCCDCGWLSTHTHAAEKGEVCNRCKTVEVDQYHQYVNVEGLKIVMEQLNDGVIYHDANHWGSSRAPILDFIEKHKLVAGEDWYEA